MNQNREIKAMLKKYSEEVDGLDVHGEEQFVSARREWIDTGLLNKIPPILERRWYVSLPGWLPESQSLDLKLKVALAEIHENE